MSGSCFGQQCCCKVFPVLKGVYDLVNGVSGFSFMVAALVVVVVVICGMCEM